MKTVEIEDVVQALALLKTQVEKKGENYVYIPPDDDFCVYFDNESHAPSCIVGHVLADLGVTHDDLIGDGINLNMETSVHDLSRFQVIKAPLQVLDVLQAAQSAQDSGDPWGEAVRLASARSEGQQ